MTLKALKEKAVLVGCTVLTHGGLPVLTHGAICFSKFHKMKFGNVVEICFWLNLAVRGLKKPKD